VLVPDALLTKQLCQDQAVELRPSRSRDAANITKEFDVVFLKQREEIGERVAAMANGVDRWTTHGTNRPSL
jgi:hypothetical protein